MAPRKPPRPAVIDGDIARIPLTRGKVAIVDVIDADLASVLWCAVWSDGWYATHVECRPTRVARKLHRVVAERAGMDIAGLEVDHINRDTLDCRRSNLRPATGHQNRRNQGRRVTNRSGHKGVNWHKAANKWQARIQTDRGRLDLGRFDSLDEAVAAYAKAAIEHHGEFARLA